MPEQNVSYMKLSMKIPKLEKSNNKLKHTEKNASTITIVAVMTLIHPEVMGPVVLGN